MTPFEEFKKLFAELKSIRLKKLGFGTTKAEAVETPISLEGAFIVVSINEAVAYTLGGKRGTSGDVELFGLRWWPASYVGYKEDKAAPKLYIKKLNHRDSLRLIKGELLSSMSEKAGAALDNDEKEFEDLFGPDGNKAYAGLLRKKLRDIKNNIAPNT